MKYNVIILFSFLLLTSGCSVDQQVNQSQPPLYTKADIIQIYNELRSGSFTDVPEKSKLVLRNSGVFGVSYPFTLKLAVNIKKLNKYRWTREAVVGLLAHELSHIVSFHQRSSSGKMRFMWNYSLSTAKMKKVEAEADHIAIERGYGAELIQERIHQFRDEKKRFQKKQYKIYNDPAALEAMMSSRDNTED